jgi:predicted nucleic-acid-binding Zn-ribbon protein
MAPKCVRCGGMKFEHAYIMPANSRFKYTAIVCSECGGVIGLAEFYNLGELMARQNQAIKSIATRMGLHVNLLTEP